jgi:hypothetical protein
MFNGLNALFGGAVTTQQSYILFGLFITLTTITLITICVQMYATFPTVEEVSTESDGELYEALPVPNWLDNGKTITLGIGIVLIGIGVILALVKNENINTAGKICMAIGTVFEFIALSFARRNRNLSHLQQIGYNITIFLLFVQAIMAVWFNVNSNSNLGIDYYKLNITKNPQVPQVQPASQVQQVPQKTEAIPIAQVAPNAPP